MQQGEAEKALAGYKIIWPEDWPDHREDDPVPDDPQVFDLLEFSYEHIAQPAAYGFHPFFSHDHLKYDQDAGRKKVTTDVNRIFQRQGLAFEMKEGEIIRMAPTGLQEALATTTFSTGHSDLDRLLETAREKFSKSIARDPKRRSGKTLGRLGATEDH